MTKDKSIRMLEGTLEANNKAIEALKNLAEAFTEMNSAIEDAMKSLRELDIATEKMAGTPKKRPSFLPCKCGKNRRWHYMTNSDGNLGIYYECMSCGFVSPSGKNERDAREKWNEAVKEATAE